MDLIQITTDRLPHPKVLGNARGNAYMRRELKRAEFAYMEDLILRNDPTEVSFDDNGGEHWPFSKAKISYDYYNNREIDIDNFHIGCKAWQDAIVAVGILKDDKPSNLELGHIKWHKCKRGKEGVAIEIEELE